MPQMVLLFQCRIVETAAKTIKNVTKELNSNNNSYPSPDGLESSGKIVEYFPKSLQIFLDNLFVGKEKICSSSIDWASHNTASSTKGIDSSP